MKERVKPAPEAIERVRQFGEKRILQFLNEVSLGSARNIAEFLPTVPGFRPKSEAGIKQQKGTLARKLTNRSGGSDRDHFALYAMWRAWAWEHLGDPDTAERLLDDLEKGLTQAGSHDEASAELERACAIAFVNGLKEMSLANKCPRETVERLLEFSPLALNEAVGNLVAAFKTSADIERDAAFTSIPDRLKEDEQEIQAIKDRVSSLAVEVGAAVAKVESVESHHAEQALALRRISEALEQQQQFSASTTEDSKRQQDAQRRLEEQFSELKTSSIEPIPRDEEISRGLASLGEQIQDLSEVVGPLIHKWSGITPIDADAVDAVAKEIGDLRAQMLHFSEAKTSEELSMLKHRVEELAAIIAVPDQLNLLGAVSQSLIAPHSLCVNAINSGPAPKSVDWSSIDQLIAGLAASLQSVGLKKSAAITLAEEVCAAALTGQVVFFKGAHANLLARQCAQTMSCNLSWTIPIPIGLTDGASLGAAVQSVQRAATRHVASIVLEGVNRSALDATKDTIISLAAKQGASFEPNLFCFASLLSGIASLPIETEYFDLGPVFDLDYLEWRLSPDNVGVASGVMSVEVAMSLRASLAQGAGDDIDEALRLVRKFTRKRKPQVERVIARGYAALKNIRNGKSDVSAMQSLSFGWLVPFWVASEITRDEADSELDGGKCDGLRPDPRIAAMLVGEMFGSGHREGAP